jgi:hypothetical protein
LEKINTAKLIVSRSKEDNKTLGLARKLWEELRTGKMIGGMKHTITQSRNSTFFLKNS